MNRRMLTSAVFIHAGACIVAFLAIDSAIPFGTKDSKVEPLFPEYKSSTGPSSSQSAGQSASENPARSFLEPAVFEILDRDTASQNPSPSDQASEIMRASSRQ